MAQYLISPPWSSCLAPSHGLQNYIYSSARPISLQRTGIPSVLRQSRAQGPRLCNIFGTGSRFKGAQGACLPRAAPACQQVGLEQNESSKLLLFGTCVEGEAIGDLASRRHPISCVDAVVPNMWLRCLQTNYCSSRMLTRLLCVKLGACLGMGTSTEGCPLVELTNNHLCVAGLGHTAAAVVWGVAAAARRGPQ